MIRTRLCPQCGIEKNLKDFHAHSRGTNNRQFYCKTCQGERAKQYYRDNYQHYKWVTQKRNMKIKVEVFSHYSNSTPVCATCGETDILVLCLDHINGGGSKHRKILGVVGGAAFYRKLRKDEYPTGYQVLCANCNLRKEMVKTISHISIKEENETS